MLSHSRGFSLIEILISMFILSLVLLGFDAIEISALRAANAAAYFSQAVMQLGSMTERLYALHHSQGLATQIETWNQQNGAVLPHGRGIVTGSDPSYSITIFWGKQTRTTCEKITLGISGCLTDTVIL